MLTNKQQKIYDYIVRYKSIYGYSPAYRDIGDSFEITVKSAYDHVKSMEKKGVLKTTKRKSRSIVIEGI